MSNDTQSWSFAFMRTHSHMHLHLNVYENSDEHTQTYTYREIKNKLSQLGRLYLSDTYCLLFFHNLISGSTCSMKNFLSFGLLIC